MNTKINKENLYSIGQFAKLNNINNRTLHFYDEIGLLVPMYRDENGYRYYTIEQAAKLELILTFRNLGMSIEEIKSHFENPSSEAMLDLIEKNTKKIDSQIKELNRAKNLLNKKKEQIKLADSCKHDEISIVKIPKKKILISPPIENIYGDEYFRTAASFSQRLKTEFGIYDSFGSMISMENVFAGNYDDYNRLFTYCPANAKKFDAEIKEGLALRSFCIGSWDLIGETYEKMKEYGKTHNLKFGDFAYEEGINELSISSMDEYITMITIPLVED